MLLPTTKSIRRLESASVGAPRRAIRCLADLVFPYSCLGCEGEPASEASAFCVNCETSLQAERSFAACPACSATVAPFEVADGRCRHCRKDAQTLDGCVRAGPYAGLFGHLLRRFKFQNREELADFMADALAVAVKSAKWLERVDGVAPVPTHWRRRVTRTYYPAQVLARLVANQIECPFVPLLRRTRAGPHQIGLSPTARLANVRGAFALRSGVILKGAKILLVDDVRTTGATLGECSKVLRKEGASEVYAAVAVRVEPIHSGSDVLQSI